MADPLKIIIEKRDGPGGKAGTDPVSRPSASASKPGKSESFMPKELKAAATGMAAVVGVVLALKKVMDKLDEFNKKDWNERRKKVGDWVTKFLMVVVPTIGVPLMMIRNFVQRLTKKVSENSEVLRGLKKFQRDAFGAVGDTLAVAFFMGYRELANSIDSIIDFAKDPKGYIFDTVFKPAIDEMLTAEDTWVGYGALKVRDFFDLNEDGKIQWWEVYVRGLHVRDMFDLSKDGKLGIADMILWKERIKDWFDINDDNKLNMTDVVMWNRKLKDMFDVNDDNKVGLDDVVIIGQRIKDIFDINEDGKLTFDNIIKTPKSVKEFIKLTELGAKLDYSELFNPKKLNLQDIVDSATSFKFTIDKDKVKEAFTDALEDVEDAINKIPGVNINLV